MEIKNDGYDIHDNPEIFRAVLRDLKTNRKNLPFIVGLIVPDNIDVESSTGDILMKYSWGERSGKFTIADFRRPSPELALIAIQKMKGLRGLGALLSYGIRDNRVNYQRLVNIRS